jgi:catechol 2,3-dioxygenase-like lactoylglutathione lyase family enzyme
MPQLNGVLETALYVADLERSIAWYERVFGFSKLLHDERMCGLSVNDRQVLLLFRLGGSTNGEHTPGGFIPPHDGHGTLHLAFAIDRSELDAWRAHLAAHNIAIESTVEVERGGTSLYFRDPDGHLLEVATPNLWPIY